LPPSSQISRRRFLQRTAAAAAGVIAGPSLPARPDAARAGAALGGECFLIGDGARAHASLFGAVPYTPQPGRIRIWRYGQERVAEIPLPFLPHAFAADPRDAQRVVTFEKWGRHMAEIDLKTMGVVRVTQAGPHRRFFGHGTHTGEYLYATQMDDKAGRGLVCVMDAASHKVLGEFDTRGAFPHDCHWLPGSNTLLVVNSRRSGERKQVHGNFSSVVWLDADSGACRKQIFIATREFGYAHLAHAADGYVVLAGSYDPPQGGSRPLLAAIRPDGAVRAFDLPAAGLQGEALGLYLDEPDRLVAVTLPRAARIQIWNYASGKLQRQIELGEPRGLAYAQQQNTLLVSSARTRGFLGLDGHLAASDSRTFAPGMGGNGSHLLRLPPASAV
jgi:hypothetical protein